MGLSCTVFNLISENTGTLKSWSEDIQGHRDWFHSTTSLWLHTSVLRQLCEIHRFGDIRFENYCDLETRDKGHSRSLDMAPFHRSDMTKGMFYSNFAAILYRF